MEFKDFLKEVLTLDSQKYGEQQVYFLPNRKARNGKDVITGLAALQNYYDLKPLQSEYGNGYEVGGKEDGTYLLAAYWETGGVSGGSCWESSDPQPYSKHNLAKELTILDQILEKYNPNIGYIQYKNLANHLMVQDSFTENEYYGNHTNYNYKAIDLEKLFIYMKDKGWLK